MDIATPNLFVCLQEAPKHILFSILTPCTTYFPSYLTLKISSLTGLTSFLSKVVRLLVRVFMVKISQNFNKICFVPYSTTLSIKKTRAPRKNLRRSKKGGVGSRVGMTAVKIQWYFFKAFL